MNLRVLPMIFTFVVLAYLPRVSATSEIAFLGINPFELTQELCDEWNAGNISDIENGVIVEVGKDTPAEKAGMKNGDILVQLNQAQIFSSRDVFDSVLASAPGENFSATVLRSGKTVTLSGTFGKYVPPEQASVPRGEVASQIFKIVAKNSELVDESSRFLNSSVRTFPNGCKLARFIYLPNTLHPAQRPKADDMIVEARCKRISESSNWECVIENKKMSLVESLYPMNANCAG